MKEKNYKVNYKKEKKIIDIIVELSYKLYKVLNLKISAKRYELYKNKLILSGLSDKITVEQFVGMKLLTVTVASTYFFIMFIINVNLLSFFMFVCGLVLSFLILDCILDIRIKKRKLRIEKELPKILNSLAIITDAGLGLIEAIKMICEVKNGVLVTELKKVMEEINMGILQSEAFYHLCDRCEVDEITVFVFTLVQSFEKGTAGVSLALNEQAKEVWENRKNKSKELGQKATIKLFLSMMIFVFPALLIFILGPAIISILKMFNN